ncbi:MAG TPA: type VI secretion system protein TssA [Geminicoccaceae bacterium]|nr:type VI secretion system protein TssA [Geminicoccaceae bacterium]
MALELESLLQPLAEDRPCGSEVRHEPLFEELVDAAEPGVEYEAVAGREVAKPKARDWSRIRRDALLLARRGRDLRLQLLLVRALAATDGWTGLGDGLALVRQSLERFWDTLWPALDTDEREPVEQAFHRLNTLRQLADGERLLAELRRVPLARARGHEPVTLRDFDLLARRLTPLPGEALPDPTLLDAVFKAAPPDELQATHTALLGAGTELELIERLLAERLGDPALVPDFAPLARLVRTAAEELARRLPAPPETVGDPVETAGGGSGGAPDEESGGAGEGGGRMRGSGMDRVASREDVVRALDLVLDYYRRNEPASPVPLLIGRAKRLVPMSFVEVLAELAPAAVEQVRAIGGKEMDGGRS